MLTLRRRATLCFQILVIFAGGCSHTPAASAPPLASASAGNTPTGHATVVWISVDGDRFDYVDRSHAPLLTRLMHEGAFTRQLTPAFPSITFASHTTEVTGTYVDQHRIPCNAFYDTATGIKYSFPDDSSLIGAEPIWQTAQRQGVRTAVIDWPLSSKQTGPNRAAYFSDSFDTTLNDQQRVQKLMDVWKSDTGGEGGNRPLRLLIGYMDGTDKAGHKYGPDAPETLAALNEDDAALSVIFEQAKAIFQSQMKPEDELYFIVTTDHGMSTIQSKQSVDRMLGADNVRGVRVVISGSVANIYLNDLPAADRAARQASILAKFAQHDFVEAYPRGDLPARWHYSDPTRVGDIVALVKKGYSWENVRTAASMPVMPGGMRGMHGYPVEQNPEMRGFAVIWRYRHPLGGVDLGKVDTVQLEPTVAAILGIQPASDAKAPAVLIK